MALERKMGTHTIVYLLRNDLRLHDNECLHYVSSQMEHIGSTSAPASVRLVPLYCFQHKHYLAGTHHFKFNKTGQPRLRFIFDAVENLKKQLQSVGSDLIVKSCFTSGSNNSSCEAVTSIFKELGINPEKKGSKDNLCTLIFHQEATPEEQHEEHSLLDLCKEYGVQLKTFWGATLFHKDDLPFQKLNDSGNPDVPEVYTQFRKSVEGKSRIRDVLPTPSCLPPLPDGLSTDGVPDVELVLPMLRDDCKSDTDVVSTSAFPFHGGENVALKRLNDYLWGSDAVASYKETRNGLVGTEYSTKFSPSLAIGCLSPRSIYAEVKRYEVEKTANQSTYWVIFELIWRDFFRFVCLKHGSKVFESGGMRGVEVNWKQDMDVFEKWRTGSTGVPFIDANMRELLKTGWMSNRGRQNVASFLVKDLGLDWRLGAEWFECMLIDHDVTSNYGNWNYAAGIGNDPRENTKFNIIKQALDYDPDGEFVRLWVPELARLGNMVKGKIHFPWKLKTSDLKSAGIELGVHYPEPMLLVPEWDMHTGGGDEQTTGSI